jgi:hypothetical protein
MPADPHVPALGPGSAATATATPGATATAAATATTTPAAPLVEPTDVDRQVPRMPRMPNHLRAAGWTRRHPGWGCVVVWATTSALLRLSAALAKEAGLPWTPGGAGGGGRSGRDALAVRRPAVPSTGRSTDLLPSLATVVLALAVGLAVVVGIIVLTTAVGGVARATRAERPRGRPSRSFPLRSLVNSVDNGGGGAADVPRRPSP